MKNIVLCSIITFAFITSMFTQDASAEETLRLQNDFGHDVIDGDIVIRDLDGTNLLPRVDDCVYGSSEFDENGLSVCFSWFKDRTTDTHLLSYRYNGKLYQRLVGPMIKSTIVKLSNFIEQTEDNYCFGNARDIDYNEDYCRQLARELQNLKEKQDIHDIPAFLQRGVDENESTALMEAARQGQINCVKALLEHGADVFAQNNTGKTALDFARENNHEEVMQLIQERMDQRYKTTKSARNVATEAS